MQTSTLGTIKLAQLQGWALLVMSVELDSLIEIKQLSSNSEPKHFGQDLTVLFWDLLKDSFGRFRGVTAGLGLLGRLLRRRGSLLGFVGSLGAG
jgi:hypothetical protein